MEWLVIFNDEVNRFFEEDQARICYQKYDDKARECNLLKIYKEVE